MALLRPAAASALLLALCVAACASPDRDLRVDGRTGPVPWTGTRAADAPGDFRFVIVSDRTGGHRDGVFEDAIERIALLRPAFVISVGDLIEGYSEDRAELDAQWREIDARVAELPMPFFYTPGNHDFSNETMARVWRERLGPSYYHFRYRDVLFLVLNSELFPGVAARDGGIPGPDAQDAQLAYAEAVLDDHRDARWTFLMIHRPLWDRRDVHPDWQRIEAWLGDRPYTVFAGHRHRYTSQRRNDRRYVTLGTTGGASRLRGLDRGEFDHVALVTVGDGEPTLANLLLDGIHGVDVRDEDTRARVRRLERALTQQPLVVPPERFRAGVAHFVVRNESEDPLHVHARAHEGRDLVPDTDALAGEIAPGARAGFAIPFRARTPGFVGALAPAPVTWTLEGRKADGTPLAIERTAWLLPEADFPVPRVAGVRVDGRLDDWAALPYAIDARPAGPDAPRGGSARFAVGHDADFVYLAARVVDPSPVSAPNRGVRDQDALQVVLDARPAPARDANEGFFHALRTGAVGEMAFAWLLPGDAREDPVLAGMLPALPEGSLQAARSTEDGYTAELAIPHGFLDARAGGPWTTFRLEVALQDLALQGDRESRAVHAWRPSRFGLGEALPVSGAGTFSRAR